MRKKRFGWVVLLLLVWLPVSAAASGAGEVLYHQQFSLLDSLEDGNVRIGTVSGPGFYTYADPWTGLVMAAGEGERGAVILPEVRHEGTFTFEFDFRFLSCSSENGYLSAILTCRGDEPSNVTNVVIRAGGAVDGFSAPSGEMAEAIRDGSWIHVAIPIREGVLSEMTLSSGDTVCTLERETVEVVSDGNLGFSVRSVSVAAENVYVVSGTGYSERSGRYAEDSYAESQRNAPPTGESEIFLIPLFASAACLVILRRRRA